jgi:hypothetical protein
MVHRPKFKGKSKTKCKTIKLPKDKTGENLGDLELGNHF